MTPIIWKAVNVITGELARISAWEMFIQVRKGIVKSDFLAIGDLAAIRHGFGSEPARLGIITGIVFAGHDGKHSRDFRDAVNWEKLGGSAHNRDWIIEWKPVVEWPGKITPHGEDGYWAWGYQVDRPEDFIGICGSCLRKSYVCESMKEERPPAIYDEPEKAVRTYSGMCLNCGSVDPVEYTEPFAGAPRRVEDTRAS